MDPETSMLRIYRRDDSRNHGWVVRVPNQRARWFGDKLHGGPDEALAAAQEYRNNLLPPPPVDLRNITRLPMAARANGWRVILIRQGVATRKRFMDEHYGGCDAALKAAQEYRDQMRNRLPRP